MKFAWIENGKVRDVCPGDPAARYTPEIAAHYTAPVPDDARNGDTWDGTTLTPALLSEPPGPVVAVPPLLTRIQFKLLFTPAERIAVRASTDPGVIDWYDILQDPQFDGVNLQSASTVAALTYLVGQGILTEQRRAAILAGEAP